jgi:hypothetical protein
MKLKRLNILFLSAIAIASSLAACDTTDHEDTLANWKWDRTEANPDIVSQGWANVDSMFGDFPAYLNVYKSPAKIGSDSVIAYIAVADMARATFGVTGDIHWDEKAQGNGNNKLFTPTEFYNNNGSPIVVINGGLFFESNGFYYSQSSAYKDGKMLAPNQNYYSEDWTNFWYPTIGFFYQKKDGTFEATWTYYANNGVDYSYASCKTIDKKTPEKSAPDATNPSKGTPMNDGTAVNGIGGVSVLLHGGSVMNTWKDEMLDVSADSNQPRTSIGYDKTNNKLFFFVCEGRQMTPGVKGLTTAKEADILKALGCTEALNLDGGGSSCMIVNGKETIKPSDGKERSVLDACYIK